MKKCDIENLRCPSCSGELKIKDDPFTSKQTLMEGELECSECKKYFPVRMSIPRFVTPENYASSFGYQWNRFPKTQTSETQRQLTRVRFDSTTHWPQDLRGQRVLEAGCGAGRFTAITLESGAEIYSFDLSTAVEANFLNIQDHPQKENLHLFQASIYEIPFEKGMFDKIYCLGVLQHCPDVKKAFMNLVPYLKNGGELAVDCYLSQPLKHAFNLKYWLRPFFKWWNPEVLFRFWTCVISIAYDLKLFFSKLPVIGKGLAALVPIGRLDYEPEYHFTLQEIKEVKTLSVFDMLSPKFDQCQKMSSFKAWMEEAGLEDVSISTGYNGINARGRKPF